MSHWLSSWISHRRLKAWLKANPVIVFSARAVLQSGGSALTHRFLFATRTTLYAEAEREAQEAFTLHVKQLAGADIDSLESKWHKGRVVNAITVNDENESVVRLVSELKNVRQHSVTHFSVTDGASHKSNPPNSSSVAHNHAKASA